MVREFIIKISDEILEEEFDKPKPQELIRCKDCKYKSIAKMDREKVIKGLESCITGFACQPECPYLVDCNDLAKPMFVELAKDTLALLKEQQERIETLESLRRIEQEGR